MKTLMLAGALSAICLAAAPSASAVGEWNPRAAADYLDQRAAWWQAWPKSQRDHETVCVSCHTMIPYVLSRGVLHRALKETGQTGAERLMFQHVEKRVMLWSEVETYYNDARHGAGKTAESRATEAVLNALVLASRDDGRLALSPAARKAFDNAFALQLTEGPDAGTWIWQDFKLAPWEDANSRYMGGTFMALALAKTPPRFRAEPQPRAAAAALSAYLKRRYAEQPMLHRLMLLWAAPETLTLAQRRTLVGAVLDLQQADGGWRLASLDKDWARRDGSAQEIVSDGYATGLVLLALARAGVAYPRLAREEGRAWLRKHQAEGSGAWIAKSLNREKTLESETGAFMSDTATAYAVMALESVH